MKRKPHYRCAVLAATLAYILCPLPSEVCAAPPAAPAATAPDPASLPGQINALSQSQQALQLQVRRLLRLGDGTQEDLNTLLTTIQQLQGQQQTLQTQLIAEQQVALALQQGGTSTLQSRGTSSVGNRASRSSALGNLGTLGNAGGSDPTIPPLTESQAASVDAQQTLSDQVRELRKQNAAGGQDLADAVNQWRANNAAVFAQAEQDNAAVHAQAVARQRAAQSLAPHAGGLAPSLSTIAGPGGIGPAAAPSGEPVIPQSMPPAKAALLIERHADFKELAQILENSNLSPAQKNTAIAQWQASHGATLGQLNTAAEAEAQALAVIAEQKAAANQPAAP